MRKKIVNLLLVIAKQEHAKAKKGNKASWQGVINRLSR